MKISRSLMRRLGTCLLCLAAVVVLATSALTVSATPTDSGVPSRYTVGTEISIPAKSFDGVEAVAMVTVPSGITYRVQDSFTPTENGIHTLTYAAYDAQGVRHEECTTFEVIAPVYAVGNARSSAKLGKYSYGNYTVDRTAILASISSTDKFSYAQIIDLKALNGESFLEFFVTPETLGVNDVYKINVVLTDLYDPENFITIAIKRGTGAETAAWLQRTSYLTANAPGQPPVGLERNKGELEIDGTMYKIQKNTVWGAGVVFALAGNPGFASVDEPGLDPAKVASQTMALSLDNENNILYANGQLVTMLSSETLYGKDIWQGFTTGECLLTIEGVEYNASALNLAITKLGENSVMVGGQVNPLFVNNTFVDTNAPVITVEAPEIVPNALCGEPYKVFPAKVQDDYSKNAKLETAVFYGYGTDSQVQLSLTDGAFVPEKAGSYTIVYRCADASGNVSVETVNVTVDGADAPKLEAQISQAVTGIAGRTYTVSAPALSNARGETKWSAVITHTEDRAVYEVNGENPEFFPEYAGTYEITYTYADYVITGTQTQSLKVDANDKPVFMEDPVLPQYILRGCVYNFPQIDVRVYSDGTPVAATPQIYVVEDGGQEKLADYRYVIYAQESVKIIYRLENKGTVTEYISDEIPVLDVGYNGSYRIAEYFDCDGMTAEPGAKRVRLRPVTQEGGKATFVNSLQVFNFALRMAASGTGADKIHVYLTDYAKPNVTVKFTYENVRGAVYFSINDGESSRLPSTAFNDKDLPLALNIQKSGTLVMPTGVTSLFYEVTQDLNGQAFTGFTHDRVYMTVEVDGVTDMKRAGVDIFSISNQIISGIYVDNVKPALSAKSAVGERPAKTEYVLYPVYFADVLDPASVCTMHVLAPDGSYAVSLEGVTLDETAAPGQMYTLYFDQLGDYTVNYVCRDIAGNELTYSYVLKSVDTKPPVVEILNPVKEGKVGGKISVAKIEISDDFATPRENFVVYASVVTPQGQTFTLLDEAGKIADSFTVTSAGVYTVSYMVMGPSGNMTVTTYTVNVK